jgi:hypothetical protein
MTDKTDWFPGKRADVLIMANTWINVLVIKGAAWGVTAAEVTALSDQTSAAEDALEKAPTTDRGPESTAKCQAAFDALETCMRNMKMLHFTQPPRTDVELVSLLLRPHDPTQTTRTTPKNSAGIEVYKYGPHVLSFRLFTSYIVDPAESGYGIRVHYGLMKAGSPITNDHPSSLYLADKTHVLSSPPLVGEDLPDSFFTRRSRDDLMLPDIASGMACYLSGCYEIEKGGAAGPYGPMIQVFVP